MKNIIKDYLVNVGFALDKNGLKEIQDALDKLNGSVKVVEKRVSAEWFLKLGEKVLAVIKSITEALQASISTVTAKMGTMDLEFQKFAISLFTTVRNARSLKTVMDAMGVKSIEDLKYVNLIPEQREQFLKLRQLSQRLELNQGQGEGLQNLRKVGYEVQRFQVILVYFWQKVAGTLGKLLEGPLKQLTAFLDRMSNKFAGNIDRYALIVAQVFQYFFKFVEQLGRMSAALFRLFPILNKLPWFLKLLADLTLYLIQKVTEELKKMKENAPDLIGGATGALAGGALGEAAGGALAGEMIGGPVGAIAGAGLGLLAGGKLAHHFFNKSNKESKENTPGAFDKWLRFIHNSEGNRYTNTSGDKGGPTKFGISQLSHPNIDVKSLTWAQAAEIYKREYWGAFNSYGFSDKMRMVAANAWVNINHSAFKKILQQAHNDPNRFLDLQEQYYHRAARMPGQGKFEKGWINRTEDLRRIINNPMQVTIHIHGANDPEKTAEKVKQKLLTMNLQGVNP